MEVCYDTRCGNGYFQGSYLDGGEGFCAVIDRLPDSGTDHQRVSDDHVYSGTDVDFCAKVYRDHACAHPCRGMDDEECVGAFYRHNESDPYDHQVRVACRMRMTVDAVAVPLCMGDCEQRCRGVFRM